MPDRIEIEILDDGTIVTKTGTIGQKNHQSADEFLSTIKELSGGKRETTPLKKSHSFALRSRDRKLTTFQK